MTRRPTLPPAASFGVAAGVLVLSLGAIGAPAMLYPAFSALWGTGPVVTTALFAVYPVALVVVMVAGGGLSDRFGRRRLMLAGVAVVAVGTVLFALADVPAWAFAGRTVQGAGVGLAMSAASAALVEYDRSGNPTRASAVNAAATSLGATAAILVGGWLVQHTADPTHLAFWILLAAVLALLVALVFLPEPLRTAVARPAASSAGRRALLAVPRAGRRPFLVGTAAVTVAFVTGAVFLGLGAQIIRDVVGTADAFHAAATLATWPLVVVPTTLLARRVPTARAVRIGGAVAAVGLALLLLAGVADSLVVFLGSALLSGVGYGFLMYGGLGLVTAAADDGSRASTFSSMYLVAYLAQGTTAVLVGALATATSLDAAVVVAVPVIVVLCLVTSVLARGR
ncbi:Inner membrane transport protein YajR [Clavibacter michiganensis]|uniref:Inner membrane transport protein YajR n=1 Tax=Clavibacter michiganensis TaxID=28447 RepID=A0A251Y8F4_9MICO|nr:MFS transporter [Clavibacter michiganensis]OUE20359.1 Inner membrane transport protein YajR [Clavibacter michiganensis]